MSILAEAENTEAASFSPEAMMYSAEHLRLVEAARANLPPYEVEVVRRSPHKGLEPERDCHGTYYQETVRFSDGAVRLMTIADPAVRRVGSDGPSPVPMIEGDSLDTGPNGLNRNIMQGYLDLGIPVYWLHHQGRHSVRPDSIEHIKTLWHFLSAKGVGRSTHQEHALLDDLGHHGHQVGTVMRGGFSRSSMQGEAFIATSDEHDRTVGYSDSQATCFAHEATPEEVVTLLLKQGPREMQAAVRLLGRIIRQDVANLQFDRFPGYLGTLDLHPLNLLHELAWMKPLLSGDSGMYAKAIPLGHVGVRTVLSGDTMSHQADQKQIHSIRPEMEVIELHRKRGRVVPKIDADDRGQDLMHLDGADREVLQLRLDRLARVVAYMRDHGWNEKSLQGLTKKDVLPLGWPLQSAA